MRRKPIPSPLERPSRVRPLVPAKGTSRLPTAAALAVALAAFGCSIPMEDGLRPDPVMKKAAPAAPAPSPSASPGLNNLEPDPHELDGDVAMVKPAPIPKPVLKPYTPGPSPSGKHKTAGKPAIVHPGAGTI